MFQSLGFKTVEEYITIKGEVIQRTYSFTFTDGSFGLTFKDGEIRITRAR